MDEVARSLTRPDTAGAAEGIRLYTESLRTTDNLGVTEQQHRRVQAEGARRLDVDQYREAVEPKYRQVTRRPTASENFLGLISGELADVVVGAGQRDQCL